MMNFSVCSLIVYNIDFFVMFIVCFQGVLLVQIVLFGGCVLGILSIVQLDVWNWEDVVYVVDDGLYINWLFLFSYSWCERCYSKNDDYIEDVEVLCDFFKEVQAYN